MSRRSKSITNLVVGVDLTSGDQLVVASDELAPTCRAAVDRAVWIARKLDASLHVLTSLDVDAVAEALIRRQHDAIGESILDAALRVLETLVESARADGLRITTGVAFGRPAHALVEDATRSRRDLVVVGSRPHGARSRAHTALELLRHCPVPVWIVRPGAAEDLRRVLAAVGDGVLAADIVDLAADLAASFGAELDVVHVVEDSSERVLRVGGAGEETVEAYRQARRAPDDDVLQRSVSRASSAGVAAKAHVRVGDPAEEIAAAVQELAADVAVLGTSLHGGIHATIWGSVAERVLSLADTSLVIVKHAAPSA